MRRYVALLTLLPPEALAKAVEQRSLFGAMGAPAPAPTHQEERAVRGHVRTSASGSTALVSPHQRRTQVAAPAAPAAPGPRAAERQPAPRPATSGTSAKLNAAGAEVLQDAAPELTPKKATWSWTGKGDPRALDKVQPAAEWATPAPTTDTDAVNAYLSPTAQWGQPMPAHLAHPSSAGNVRGPDEYVGRAFLGRVTRENAPLAALWGRMDTGEVLAYPEDGGAPVSLGGPRQFADWRMGNQQGFEGTDAGRMWSVVRRPENPEQAARAATRLKVAATARADGVRVDLDKRDVAALRQLTELGKGFCNRYLREALSDAAGGVEFKLTSWDQADAVAAGLGELLTTYGDGPEDGGKGDEARRVRATLGRCATHVRGWMDAEELRLRDYTRGAGFPAETGAPNLWTRAVRALASGQEPAEADIKALREPTAGRSIEMWGRGEQMAALPGLEVGQIRDVCQKLFRRLKG